MGKANDITHSDDDSCRHHLSLLASGLDTQMQGHHQLLGLVVLGAAAESLGPLGPSLLRLLRLRSLNSAWGVATPAHLCDWRPITSDVIRPVISRPGHAVGCEAGKLCELMDSGLKGNSWCQLLPSWQKHRNR